MRVERQLTGAHRGRQRTYGGCARPRQADPLERGVLEYGGLWKRPCETFVAARHSCPEGTRQPCDECCSARDGRLLSHDRSDRQLERIPRAWHSESGTMANARAQERIEQQMPADGVRVGVEVEHQPEAAQDAIHRLRVGMPDLGNQSAAGNVM